MSGAGTRKPPPRRARRGLLLAGQLTQRWNKQLWGRAAKIVAKPASYTRDPVLESPAIRRQAQRRLSEPTWAKIASEYQSGFTAGALGRRYGVDDQTVINQLRARGIRIRPQRAAIRSSDHQDLLTMKERGWNNTEIAQHYGSSRQAVQQALRRALQGNAECVK